MQKQLSMMTPRLRIDNSGAMNSSPTRTYSRFGLFQTFGANDDKSSFVLIFFSIGFYTSNGLFLQHSAQHANFNYFNVLSPQRLFRVNVTVIILTQKA